MIKFWRSCMNWSLSIVSAVFMFLPESCFSFCKLSEEVDQSTVVLINRLLAFLGIIVAVAIVKMLHMLCRRSVTIKGHNYCIKVVYGDLFEQKKCKKVIAFDECYTTEVGDEPNKIKSTSICGQYLDKYPIEDVSVLIRKAKITPNQRKSNYNNQTSYPVGSIIPRGEYLLMAFAKLDERGLGRLSRDEYIDGLSLMWRKINEHYNQCDICVPVLGSGITRIGESELTQQELLDMIIASYKMSGHKVKAPHTLYIVCKKTEDFTLNRIGSYI